jgi:hypothetical protein
MLKMKTALLALGLTIASVPEAAAQMQWRDKIFVNVNFGVQIGSQDVVMQPQFTLYDEPASFDGSLTLGSEPIFVDFAGGYRVTSNLAVAFGFVNYNTETDVTGTARIPHPIITDAFRTVNVTAPGISHNSNMFNFSAVWFWPYTDQIDFAFYAGPSIVAARQDVISGLTIAPEPGPDYSNPQISSVEVSEQSKTSFGIHFGADGAYMVNKRYGVGAGIRYVWGSADFDGLTDSVTLGGFQIVGGLRVRF